ncbi:hypothetical protein OC846_006227 [Tilletia horrida]|uniref:Serum paraoxonase/arylesterase n=1 Tax=Tilletia horrida TaxID=155126 RepID=A0AAN6GJ85_9BASI|nr:hypothetical protein OC845_006249 [Tilletia horrida]KAK0543970.1 hypothetical protein OC846_006227 [Tilletia horrida]KAK0559324.1 hypothetical protein OC861_006680 [Tilletia horrida]
MASKNDKSVQKAASTSRGGGGGGGAGILLTIAGVGLLALAVLYQTHLAPSIWAFAGIGRKLDPNLTSLAASRCQKFTNLEGCEDAWMHQDSGLLYLACSSLAGRRKWLPTMDKLEASQRPTDDAIYILDTRAKGPWASRITKVQPTSFHGILGDSTLNLHGIGVLEVSSKPAPQEGDDIVLDTSYTPPTLYLYLNNHRPPLDPNTGKIIPDATKTGANSTVEIFKTTLGSNKMEHVRTYAHEAIRTPNRVAPVSPDSFLFTNDHGRKVGHLRVLSYVSNDGDAGFCDPSGCKIVADKMAYPNGIVASDKPRQFWIPNMREGRIKIYEWQPKDQSLVLIDDFYLDGPPGYPADNLSLNSKTGAILAASLPQGSHAIIGHFRDFRVLAASTIHRITLNEGKEKFFGAKYKMDKILEFDGKEYGAYTTAIEDEAGKQVWLMGVGAPHVAVCKLEA